MHNVKPVHVPLPSHLKLGNTQCPNNEEEKEEMSKVPYSSDMGSLMYVIDYTIIEIYHAVGVMTGFLLNLGK